MKQSKSEEYLETGYMDMSRLGFIGSDIKV